MEAIWHKILEKIWDDIMLAPLLVLFVKPIKVKVNGFLKNISPWYINTYYRSAASNNTNRISLFLLIILTAFIFVLSEIAVLELLNPSIPVLDSAFNKAPQWQIDKITSFLIFLINVLIFILVIRVEGINSTITRFNLMLAIIRPDIEPDKYYKLKREWALMKSVDQYKKIIIEVFSNHKMLIDSEKFPEEVKILKKHEEAQKKTT